MSTMRTGRRTGAHESIRICIAGGQAILRAGLGQELGRIDDFEIVGETNNFASLREDVTTRHPQVLVLSGALDDCSAINCVRKVRRIFPNGASGASRPAILIISRTFNRQHLFSFLLEDVSGYIHENGEPEFVCHAVRQVSLGHRVLSREAQALLIEMVVSLHQKLTNSEVAVLRRAARGLTDKEIAVDLAITQGTVRNHLANIYRKIPPVRSRAEAVAWAWISDLVE